MPHHTSNIEHRIGDLDLRVQHRYFMPLKERTNMKIVLPTYLSIYPTPKTFAVAIAIDRRYLPRHVLFYRKTTFPSHLE